MKKYTSKLITLLLILILSIPLNNLYASVVLQLPLNELVQNADIIVHVKITDLQSKWFITSNKQSIRTTVTALILTPIKNMNEKTVQFDILGGKIDDVTQQVSGEADFQVGDEAIIFLEKVKNSYILLGMSMGKFEVLELEGQKYARHAIKNLQPISYKLDPESRKMTPQKTENSPIPTQKLDDFIIELQNLSLSSQNTSIPQGDK